MKNADKYPQNALQNAKDYISHSNIPLSEKAVLERYFKSLLVGDGSKVSSHLTIRGAIYTVKCFGEYIKRPLEGIEKEHIVDYLAFLKERGLQDVTVGFYATGIRRFYVWMDGKDSKRVSWIKKVSTKRDLHEADLIQPSEINKIVGVCNNARDKAIISGLYDSACRISEWLGVRIRDLIFDDYGAKVKVSGKTGTRTIRLIDSVPYLVEWLNQHPYKGDQNAYLWVGFASNHYGERLYGGSVHTKLRTYAKRAGITKKIFPHLLRHSRLTWLAQKEGFNERDLRLFAGWSEISEMPNTYLHYGEEEVDKKLRHSKGLSTEGEMEQETAEREALQPKICARCHKQNPATALYCNCGMALDIKTIIEDTKKREEADSMMNDLFQDGEFRNIVKEFMRKKQEPTKRADLIGRVGGQEIPF